MKNIPECIQRRISRRFSEGFLVNKTRKNLRKIPREIFEKNSGEIAYRVLRAIQRIFPGKKSE